MAENGHGSGKHFQNRVRFRDSLKVAIINNNNNNSLNHHVASSSHLIVIGRDGMDRVVMAVEIAAKLSVAKREEDDDVEEEIEHQRYEQINGLDHNTRSSDLRKILYGGNGSYRSHFYNVHASYVKR